MKFKLGVDIKIGVDTHLDSHNGHMHKKIIGNDVHRRASLSMGLLFAVPTIRSSASELCTKLVKVKNGKKSP